MWMFEQKYQPAYQEALERSIQLIDLIYLRSNSFRLYSQKSHAMQLYPFFLTYAYDRTRTAFMHLRNGNLFDAAISARSALDGNARAYACCFHFAGYLPGSEKNFTSFFLLDLRRNKKKTSDLSESIDDPVAMRLLETLSNFDKMFFLPLNSADLQSASSFFEFPNIMRSISEPAASAGIPIPKDHFILSYNLLSAYVHVGGMAIMAFEKAKNPNDQLDLMLNLSNLVGVIGILVSSWYQMAQISKTCLSDIELETVYVWKEVEIIQNLIQPISDDFHTELRAKLR
jgi:hypothetical protein